MAAGPITSRSTNTRSARVARSTISTWSWSRACASSGGSWCTSCGLRIRTSLLSAGEDPGPKYNLDALTFRVADTDRFDETLDQVHSILLTTHRGIQDFDFDTRLEYADQIEQSIRNTRMSGGIIAGISLLVGG